MKKAALILFPLLAVVALFTRCETDGEKESSEQLSNVDLSHGFNLLESNCFSCHSPKGSHDARVAPPMVAIKNHYIGEETGLEEFSEALIAFVQNPSQENARMKGAIRKFGLMPKMEFSESELRDIAAYIYTTELEAPDWYAGHYERERKRHRKHHQGGEVDYLERGRQFAMQTKAQLGKNLMAAINEKGSEGAVSFCNVRAYPLTDSMAVALDAKIKRVSDRPRNPNNRANDDQLNYILNAKARLEQGLDIEPQLKDRGESVIGYYPITTNAMCLKCHGEPKKDINQATLEVLAELYPEDEAKGYGENELRGIWVVEMQKETPKSNHHVKGKGKRPE
jgi:cytochrome c553